MMSDGNDPHYDYQVLGNSGTVYHDVPKEVWERIPKTKPLSKSCELYWDSHKRIVAK